MKISLCIITKNEERHIKKCINSVSDIVDEIVVVDTGSKDKTVSIAKSLGAKIFEYEWCGDFSKARNFAIEQCSGKWIIFLDADEYLKEGCTEELKSQIRNAHNNNKEAILFEIINIDEENTEIYDISKNIRAFKKHPMLRYVQPIHEVLEHINRSIKAVDATSKIKLYHTGYSPNIIKEKNKSKRNLDLLFSQLEKDSNHADTYYYIVESLMVAERYEEALIYCDKVEKYKIATIIGIYIKNKLNKMNCLVKLKKEEDTILKVYTEAIQLDSSFPDYDYVMAKYYLDNKIYDKVEYYLKQCIIKMDSYNGMIAINSLGECENIFEVLSKIQISNGDFSNAVITLVNIIKYNKYNVYASYQLINILVNNEKVQDVYNFMRKLYDYSNVKDIMLLMEISKKIEIQELYDLFKIHVSLEN